MSFSPLAGGERFPSVKQVNFEDAGWQHMIIWGHWISRLAPVLLDYNFFFKSYLIICMNGLQKKKKNAFFEANAVSLARKWCWVELLESLGKAQQWDQKF